MQRLRSHPAHVGSESAQAIHEPGHPLADGIVDIKSNKESHEHSLERRSQYMERRASLTRRPAGRPSLHQKPSAISYQLHQLSSYHVERQLRREPAHPFPISGELALFYLRAVFTCE